MLALNFDSAMPIGTLSRPQRLCTKNIGVEPVGTALELLHGFIWTHLEPGLVAGLAIPEPSPVYIARQGHTQQTVLAGLFTVRFARFQGSFPSIHQVYGILHGLHSY